MAKAARRGGRSRQQAGRGGGTKGSGGTAGRAHPPKAGMAPHGPHRMDRMPKSRSSREGPQPDLPHAVIGKRTVTRTSGRRPISRRARSPKFEIPGRQTSSSTTRASSPSTPRGGRQQECPRTKLKISARPEVMTFKNRKFSDGAIGDVHSESDGGPPMIGRSWAFVPSRRSAPRRPSFHWNGRDDGDHEVRRVDIAILRRNSADGQFTLDGQGLHRRDQGQGNPGRGPLSRYVYLGDLLYEIQIDPAGTEDQVPGLMTGRRGALQKLDYKIATMAPPS